MSIHLPRDAKRPSFADSTATAGKSRFYTKAGWLTRYALSCGYVQIRGTDESGARLEQISSNGTLRVAGDGRWIRGEVTSYHTSLAAARRAFATMDHVAASENIHATHARA